MDTLSLYVHAGLPGPHPIWCSEQYPSIESQQPLLRLVGSLVHSRQYIENWCVRLSQHLHSYSYNCTMIATMLHWPAASKKYLYSLNEWFAEATDSSVLEKAAKGLTQKLQHGGLCGTSMIGPVTVYTEEPRPRTSLLLVALFHDGDKENGRFAVPSCDLEVST